MITTTITNNNNNNNNNNNGLFNSIFNVALSLLKAYETYNIKG